MTFYSINKRLRGERTAYSTSVKQKNKGKIVFSKFKSFTSGTAAQKWAKALISQLEADETNMIAGGYRKVTFCELVREYEKYKAKSNKLLRITASCTDPTIVKYPIADLVASNIFNKPRYRKNCTHGQIMSRCSPLYCYTIYV